MMLPGQVYADKVLNPQLNAIADFGRGVLDDPNARRP